MFKVAVDPRGDSQVDPQTTLPNVMTKFIVSDRIEMHEKLTSICFFTITNCPLLLDNASHNL